MLVTSLVMILALGVDSSSMASVAARRMKGQMKEWRVSVGDIRQTSSLAGLFYILNCEIMLKDSNNICVSYLFSTLRGL